MVASEHVSMETGMSGDTAEPTAAGSCARREADQQCAVAGFVVLEPWAETPWRTVRACSIERQATVAFHDHQGCTLAAPTVLFIGNCRTQCRAAKVS